MTDEAKTTTPEAPRPAFGCACPSSDARTCIAIRYGRDRYCDDPTEPCECACHQEDDDDDEW
ncbi:hypothetical protein [Falsiroseomonas sp. CW058]|uniref:hypothetical protein n=1 Tax=Falsiroseomonas sp. CW058 TaxID=3388664 RepID=UPI003D322070